MVCNLKLRIGFDISAVYPAYNSKNWFYLIKRADLTKVIYSIAGLLVGAAVNVLINLLAAAIQKKVFADQFSQQSIWWLLGFLVVGLLIGYWLSANVNVPASTNQQQSPQGQHTSRQNSGKVRHGSKTGIFG